MKLFEQIEWPPPGRYIVAVSGGVDSVALLDLLAGRANELKLELAVAYIDHGWRDASADEKLVKLLAERYGYSVQVCHLRLHGKSEAEARRARYAALDRMRAKAEARAIITAHHLDDRIETVILNVLRGTGRRGLSSLRTTGQIVRPLLKLRKNEILTYAKDKGLRWVEDPTNLDTAYRRNWVRRVLIPSLEDQNPNFFNETITLLAAADKLNLAIDRDIKLMMQGSGCSKLTSNEVLGIEVDYSWLATYSVTVLQELLLAAINDLRPGVEVDGRTIERLALDLKTGRLGSLRTLAKRLSVGRSRGKVTIAFKAS